MLQLSNNVLSYTVHIIVSLQLCQLKLEYNSVFTYMQSDLVKEHIVHKILMSGSDGTPYGKVSTEK